MNFDFKIERGQPQGTCFSHRVPERPSLLKSFHFFCKSILYHIGEGESTCTGDWLVQKKADDTIYAVFFLYKKNF